MTAMIGHAEIPLKIAAGRAVIGRCPCCGKGRLFQAYLKQVEECAVCGEKFGAIRADDAAPWATIIVIGHIFLPLAFLFDTSAWSTGTVAGTMAAGFAGLAMALLPRAKGLMIGILWQTRAPGYA